MYNETMRLILTIGFIALLLGVYTAFQGYSIIAAVCFTSSVWSVLIFLTTDTKD